MSNRNAPFESAFMLGATMQSPCEARTSKNLAHLGAMNAVGDDVRRLHLSLPAQSSPGRSQSEPRDLDSYQFLIS